MLGRMSHGLGRGLSVAALLLALTACTGDPPPPAAAPSPSAAPSVPAYDAALEPAAAALALVPDDVRTLEVTDYDRVRAELGVDSLTTASPVAEQDAFWARADAEAPLLSTGMLRPVEARLRADYGLSQSDVAWEAHLLDGSGAEVGWVLGVRSSTLPTSVQRAVADGVGPLAGSTWRAADRIVVKGTTDDGTSSWAADPVTPTLVGPRATSTYLTRGCLEGEPSGRTFEELTQWSVGFEDTLVTARLGLERLDLFDRMRQASADPTFAAAYEGGVSDPSTGRIGFRMTDPVQAARLALQGRLPFAACGSA